MENKNSKYSNVTEQFLNNFYPTMSKSEAKMLLLNKRNEAVKPLKKINSEFEPFHETCRLLSIDTYNNYDPSRSIDGYKVFFSDANPKTGFYAKAYKNTKTNSVIIAFRGTNDFKDIKNDAFMGINNLPAQYYDAEKFYNDVREKLGSSIKYIKIGFTGHSLGGSLAELLGAKFGNKTVTFNSYGAGHIKNAGINYKDNIVNYGNFNDFVFNANGGNHIGKIIKTAVYNQPFLNKRTNLDNHLIEDMDLKEIYDDSKVEEYKTLKEELTRSGGMVQVSGYTRSDGTDVSSYSRRPPSR